MIFDKNPGHEFFVEESYPLEWMYPYLSPHGLIFQLNREPLPALTAEMLAADHAFWAKQCDAMIGGWLKPETSLSNVCTFAAAVYGAKDRSRFTGDPEYVTNEFAMESFSKLRCAIAGLYDWRLVNPPAAGEDQRRLKAEAEQAFRPGLALCPANPEVVYRYVNHLLREDRMDDAILLVGTTLKLAWRTVIEDLLSKLREFRRNAPGGR